MFVELKKTETHKTVIEGRLTSDQFRRLLTDALAREIGVAGRYETTADLSLELTLDGMLAPSVWPDAHFIFTKDHMHREPDMAAIIRTRDGAES